MRRLILAASAVALLATPAFAQSASDELFFTAADQQMMRGGDLIQIRATYERVLRANDLDLSNRTEAQALLGAMLLNGEGGPADVGRGIDLLQLASASGWANADYHLGKAYLNGQGVAKDVSTALRFFDRAYNSTEHYDAAYEAAKIRLASRAQPFEVKRAMEQLEHAGNGQNAEALALMAWSMETGTNTVEDVEGALDLYLMAEAEGHPAASAALDRLAQHLAERGDAYSDQGQDTAAFLNYQRACMAGHGGGCWGEALSHMNGYGTDVSEIAAKESARIACQLKVDPEACHAFAQITINQYGDATPADHRQAFNTYRERCNKGGDVREWNACYNQAYMMLYQNYDVPNYEAGKNLMVETCMIGGDSNACAIGLPLFNRDMAPTLASLPNREKKKSGWFGKLLGDAAGGLVGGFAAMGQVQTSGYTSSYTSSSSNSRSSYSSYQADKDWNNAINSITSYGTGYQTTCRPGNPYC